MRFLCLCIKFSKERGKEWNKKGDMDTKKWERVLKEGGLDV